MMPPKKPQEFRFVAARMTAAEADALKLFCMSQQKTVSRFVRETLFREIDNFSDKEKPKT